MSLYGAPALGRSTSVCVGRVWVVARHLLVAQALAAALGRRIADVRAMPWAPGTRRVADREALEDVLLLVDPLDSTSAVVTARTLLADAMARTVVMTGLARGPLWGALLVAGATEVIADPESIDELAEIIERICADVPVMTAEERQELIAAWQRQVVEDEELLDRMRRLSPRELLVLESLAAGERSTEIADSLGVAESTVRTHVRSIRRKLSVDSQLRAVLVAHRLRDRVPPMSLDIPGPRRPYD
jgi:DNA-binding NarL/FixJ family response regulator